MTVAWNSKPLGEVCAFLNRGISPAYLESGGIRVLNQRCIRDHEVNFDLARRHDLDVKEVAPERLVRAGDVLINSTGTGTLGRVAQLRVDPSEPTTVDSHVTIARPIPDLFCKEFFGYALVFLEDQLQEGGEGCGGQTELSRSKLAQAYRVRFPVALHEQRRVVAVLDEAFKAVATAMANTERNLQNAREVFESQLRLAFERPSQRWPHLRLGDICERVSVGHVGPTSQFYCEPTVGVPFLRSQNVRRGRLSMEGLRFITVDFHRQLRKSQLRAGDLLFVRVGANRGDCCAVPADIGEINCANIVFARPREQVSHYLQLYCQSLPGRRQLLGMTTGAAQGVINTSSVAELVVPMPPAAERQALEDQLDGVAECSTQLQRIYEQKREALAQLKLSLLRDAFAGALTVRRVDKQVAAMA